MTNWINKINFTDNLHAANGDNDVLNLAQTLVKKLKNTLLKSNSLLHIKKELDGDTLGYITDNLNEVIENFQNLIDAIQDGESYDSYGFESWSEWFDENLEELYLVADMPVNNSKFLLIA